MTRLEFLYEVQEQIAHNLMCYSKDVLVTKPKDEYINEWKKEKEKENIIENMIEEEVKKLSKHKERER